MLGSACHRGSPTNPSVTPPPVTDTSAPPQLSCPAPLAPSGRTFYVAMNQAGASNDRCDGLSPVDSGNGHCPYKDFASAKTFALLRGVSGVRVEVRAGVYTFPDEAISIEGTGVSDFDRVVLAAYQNEAVVFDGRGALREVIRMGGRFTGLERVSIRGAAAYNVEIGGGSDHIVQCNRFLANVASDSLKGDNGAANVLIRHNDFSQWDSNAIDMTAIRNWRIEDNDFHDPKDSTGISVGAKFGSRDVFVTGNRIRNTRGFALGGVSSPHADDYETYNMRAENNTFENVTGAIVRFYSCLNCAFNDNSAKAVGGGFVLFGEQTDGPSGCAGGCKPTQGASIFRNRLTDLRGNPSNTFWGLYSTQGQGLTAGNNTYCTPPDQDGRFRFNDKDLTFPDWTTAVGTDSSSISAKMNTALCTW
jgi:hypothetical protein